MHRLILSAFVLWASGALADDCDPSRIKEELIARSILDQEARRALMASPNEKELSHRALRVDTDNTDYMRSLLATCGWPKRSLVGEEAAKAAWLLTQHADMDPQHQVAAARLMKHAVLAKEADPARLALLVDRNRRLSDQPQVYGMQFYTAQDDVIRFFDIVTPAQLDARRAEIGLEPFFCYAISLSKRHANQPLEWPAGVLLVHDDCRDAS